MSRPSLLPPSRRRRARSALALVAALCAPATAGAADAGGREAPGGGRLFELINANVSARANGALAMLGMTLVPSETASTLALNTGAADGVDYQASQFGGAFTISDSFPLYLEGFAGFSRYDPIFIFSDGKDQSRLPAKWNTVGASGGIGWDFKLTDKLVLRPIANIGLGYMESDASLLTRVVSRRTRIDLDFIKRGKLAAAGLGGSVMLAYADSKPAYETNVELRYTHLYMQPAFGSKAIDASSNAATLGLWSRLRVPTGIDIFGSPLRGVYEFSGSLLPGDQGKVLNTDWLAQVGSGFEFDMSKTAIPLSRIRVMLRYTQGEELTGYSLGLGASF